MIKGIILVSPKRHCNVGGIARSMAAFGVHDLVICNPQAQCSMTKAQHISEQGKEIVKNYRKIDRLSKIAEKKVATISAFDRDRYVPDLELLPIEQFDASEEFY